MKIIRLTQGKVARVDNEDFEYLIQFTWYARRDGNNWYALGHIKTEAGWKTTLMHRVVAARAGFLAPRIDHRDTDGLNNCRKNLRPATQSQNQINRGRNKNNTSGYKGVSWDGCVGKWRADIRISGRRKQLGRFTRKRDAVKARKHAERVFYGEFAYGG